jgi:uroporphyrinogen decarboxylase
MAKKTVLTSKERVRLSLNWQEPDRVPIQVYLTPEMEQRLNRHFTSTAGVAASSQIEPGIMATSNEVVLRKLGVDFRGVWPAYRGQRQPPHDGLTFDEWGTGYRHVSNPSAGTYDEAVVLPLADLQTMDDVCRYPWPRIEDYDFSGLAAQCDRLRDYAVVFGSAGIPDILNGVSRGRGMEQVVMDIALRDEVGLAIIDRRVDFWYQWMRKGLEAAGGKVDIIALGEDTGNQNARMFSPKDFDEVFRPRLKKFYDLAHEFGAKVMMHSCGDSHEIMPTFIEMGLDILDAMQPEPAGMDPETIRTLCRGKLAFCGLISTQQTLPYGSVEDCRREARHRLDVIAPGGGYIFSPAHCIQPDTPIENVLAIYEEALGHSLS